MKLFLSKSNSMSSVLSQRSIYHACVTVMFFLVAFKNLAIISSYGEIKALVSLLELICDFVLFIVYITKVRNLKGAAIFIALVSLCLISAWCSKSFLAIKGLLLVVGATNEDYPSILKSGSKAIFLVMIIGLCCQLLGIPSSDFRRGGLSLGFVHPNQAALFSVELILMLYVSNDLRGISQKYDWLYWLFGIGCIFATGSRTALFSVVLSVGLSLLIKSTNLIETNPFRFIFGSMPFLLLVFSFVSAYTLFDSTLFQKMDYVLSNRIWLNWFALNTFDISAFGREISLHVAGVHNTLRDTWNITTTVDCTYVAASLSYGVFGISMWLMGYHLAFRRAWNARKASVVAALVIFSLYAFSESQLTDVLINFGLICTFSNLDNKRLLIKGSASSVKIVSHSVERLEA